MLDITSEIFILKKKHNNITSKASCPARFTRHLPRTYPVSTIQPETAYTKRYYRATNTLSHYRVNAE